MTRVPPYDRALVVSALCVCAYNIVDLGVDRGCLLVKFVLHESYPAGPVPAWMLEPSIR